MKVVLEVHLEERDEPKYVLRSAALLEKLARALREEAAGGVVMSAVGSGILSGSESIGIVAIERP